MFAMLFYLPSQNTFSVKLFQRCKKKSLEFCFLMKQKVKLNVSVKKAENSTENILGT